MGIILGALAGAADNVNDSLAKQNALQTESDISLQRAEALAQFQQMLKLRYQQAILTGNLGGGVGGLIGQSAGSSSSASTPSPASADGPTNSSSNVESAGVNTLSQDAPAPQSAPTSTIAAAQTPSPSPDATSSATQPGAGAVSVNAADIPALAKKYGVPEAALRNDLAFNDGKGIAHMIFEAAMPTIQVVNGVAIDTRHQKPGFVPSLSTSADGKTTVVSIGADGQPVVSMPPGAAESYGTYRGIDAGVTAATTPIKIYNPVTKREEYVSTASVLWKGGAAGPGGAQAQFAPSLEQVLDGLKQTESSGNPLAVNPQSGAMGPYQFMPGTVAMLHKQGIAFDPFNESQARTAAGMYLTQLLQKNNGDLRGALADYGGFVTKDPTSYVNSVLSNAGVTANQTGQGGSATQSSSTGATGSGNAAAGPSATETAAAAGRKAFDEARAKQAVDYETALNGRVQQGSELNMRLQQQLQALSQFKAGGGADTRAKLAQLAQGVPGMPDSFVNAIANGGSGNQQSLAAMQEFQKLAAQTAMEQLKQAMGGSGRISQYEFKVFAQNNPNLSTDPEAIRKIADFATHLYTRDLSEQQAYSSFLNSGGDPPSWPATWSKMQTQLGFTNPGLKATPQASAPPSPSSSPTPSRQGWVIREIK
jgi:hypothetical protein